MPSLGWSSTDIQVLSRSWSEPEFRCPLAGVLNDREVTYAVHGLRRKFEFHKERSNASMSEAQVKAVVKELLKAESGKAVADGFDTFVDMVQQGVLQGLVEQKGYPEYPELFSVSPFEIRESVVRSAVRDKVAASEGSVMSYQVPQQGELVKMLELEGSGDLHNNQVGQSIYWSVSPYAVPGTRAFTVTNVSSQVRDQADARSWTRDHALGQKWKKKFTQGSSKLAANGSPENGSPKARVSKTGPFGRRTYGVPKSKRTAV